MDDQLPNITILNWQKPELEKTITTKKFVAMQGQMVAMGGTSPNWNQAGHSLQDVLQFTCFCGSQFLAVSAEIHDLKNFWECSNCGSQSICW